MREGNGKRNEFFFCVCVVCAGDEGVLDEKIIKKLYTPYMQGGAKLVLMELERRYTHGESHMSVQNTLRSTRIRCAVVRWM